jgi:hypothetical protein
MVAAAIRTIFAKPERMTQTVYRRLTADRLTAAWRCSRHR